MVYYRATGGLHYRVFTVFSTESREEREVHFAKPTYSKIAFCAYASNLWNMFYYTYSECLHVSRFELEQFPLGLNGMDSRIESTLLQLANSLDTDIKRNATMEVRNYRGKGAIDCYTVEMRASKPIIDEIDRVLAEHYGFTDEELDFIINYDIKYRMGAESGDEGDGA